MKTTRKHLLPLFIVTIGTACITLFFAGTPKSAAKIHFQEITIEGCQYIYVDENPGNFRLYSITHKGNCNNPIHQCQ